MHCEKDVIRASRLRVAPQPDPREGRCKRRTENCSLPFVYKKTTVGTRTHGRDAERKPGRTSAQSHVPIQPGNTTDGFQPVTTSEADLMPEKKEDTAVKRIVKARYPWEAMNPARPSFVSKTLEVT